MGTKEMVLRLADQLRRDFWEKGEVVLQSPVLVQAAECVRRFVLGAVLSRSVILSACAPFALGWIGASGPGPAGFSALLGAMLGYFVGFGLVEGLRYVAAAVLVYVTAFALYDFRGYKRSWFMPLVTGVMTGTAGFIYLSEAGWTPTVAAGYLTELLLAGLSCLCYRQLPGLLEEREEATAPHRLFLLATVFIALYPLRMGFDLSPGAVLACFFVLPAGTCAHRVAVGAGMGMAVDLAAGSGGLYTCALGAGGLLTSLSGQRGRLLQVGLFLLAGVGTMAWLGGTAQDAANLLLGGLLTLALPKSGVSWLRRTLQPEAVPAFVPLPVADGQRQTVQRQLGEQAAAFRQLSQQLEGQLREKKPEPPGEIFDRTADRVCRGCALQKLCWQRDYRSTYELLHKVLQVMEERGYCRDRDFPDSFTSRCLRIRTFVTAANEELYAWRHRKRFQVRLREQQRMVARQFRQVSHLLEDTAMELDGALTPDEEGTAAAKRALRGSGVTAAVTVQRDSRGRRLVELSGEGLSPMADADGRKRLSHALGTSLETGTLSRTQWGQRLRFRESPGLAARVGAAARPKDGESVSGDSGTWFKDEGGTLWVALCDGMGVGNAAAAESRLALRLLERFLRAGVTAETALHTLTGALAVRAQEQMGFSTVDLLRVDLFTGEGLVYKLGAPPSYLRKNGMVDRLGKGTLPPGTGQEEQVDLTRFQTGAGDLVVLVTDGVADGVEDRWLQEHLESYRGESPRELAMTLLEDPHARRDDDRTAVVVQFLRREEV